MAEPGGIPSLEPTQDERTMAVLAHVLQLVGTFIGPLVIFLVKRDSRFVSFHALQALLLQALYILFTGIVMIGFFTAMFAGVAAQHDVNLDHHSGPPPPFFFLFPLIWLGMMGFWVTMMVIAIVYGIKAGHGEWADYPILGRLARRILKMPPSGPALQPFGS